MTRMKPNDDLHLYEKAVYKEQKISDYAGNPLIEALPPILESEDEVIDAFYNFPYISDEEKRLSPRLKSHLLWRVKSFLQPLPAHIRLESIVSKVDVLLRYKNLLYEKDLATNRLRVKQDELHEMVVDHYGTELLEILESGIDKSDEYNWLRVVTRGVTRIVHPLRHIFLILFMTGDMDTFFKGISHAYNPFGKGPWPCLNKASDHYKQDVVTQLTVTVDSKTRESVGTFACECGYIYSRKGPDKLENDRYRKGRVKAFGHVWEDKLKTLLSEHHSYREMARQLGCDIGTVQKFEVILAEQNSIDANPDRSYQKVSVSNLNEEYRERMLRVIKEYPELSRTDLRNQCQKEYAFLYLHDKEWLFEMLPTGKPQKGSKGYVDWDQRDQEVLSKLQKAQIELLNREKPIRISKTSLGKEIVNLSLIEKHLHKLPCCAEFIDRVSETKQRFQLRRCQIIVRRMHEEGLPLLDWRIQREAGLRKEDYELIQGELEMILHGNHEDSLYG